jgi:benzil reductase ((S)-benzoin forming)
MRTTIITGVSRGLGAALLDRLLDAGDRVVALGRTFTDAQRDRAWGQPGRLALRPVDLADPADVPGAPELAALLPAGPGAGPVEDVALVHNAGVVEPIGAVGDLDPAAVATAVAVNLTAPMLLTNALLATLPPAARLRVLFISAGAAPRVVDGGAPYCATKAGGEMFFRVLAEQFGDDPRRRVASVNPGVMDTGMQERIRSTPAGHFPDRDRYLGLHQRGELPDPDEVARRIIDGHLAG